MDACIDMVNALQKFVGQGFSLALATLLGEKGLDKSSPYPTDPFYGQIQNVGVRFIEPKLNSSVGLETNRE